MDLDIVYEAAEIIPIMPSTKVTELAAREIMRTGSLRFNRSVRERAIAEDARIRAEHYARSRQVAKTPDRISFWDAARALFGLVRLYT
jgi:hypothetical protein